MNARAEKFSVHLEERPARFVGVFDLLLNKAGVVCTPGAGFGRCGRGYIRISAFNQYENVQKAMERIKTALA